MQPEKYVAPEDDSVEIQTKGDELVLEYPGASGWYTVLLYLLLGGGLMFQGIQIVERHRWGVPLWVTFLSIFGVLFALIVANACYKRMYLSRGDHFVIQHRLMGFSFRTLFSGQTEDIYSIKVSADEEGSVEIVTADGTFELDGINSEKDREWTAGRLAGFLGL